MEKFQELYEEIQFSILDIFNNMSVILNSDSKTSDTKVNLLKQYVKEQTSMICSDISIHNDNELDQLEKLHLVQ